jgi:hypothetical protein
MQPSPEMVSDRNVVCSRPRLPMDIRFVSSLDAGEEERIAAALLLAISRLLDDTALPYTLRIKTIDQRVYEHRHPALESARSQLPAADLAPRRAPLRVMPES